MNGLLPYAGRQAAILVRAPGHVTRWCSPRVLAAENAGIRQSRELCGDQWNCSQLSPCLANGLEINSKITSLLCELSGDFPICKLF